MSKLLLFCPKLPTTHVCKVLRAGIVLLACANVGFAQVESVESELKPAEDTQSEKGTSEAADRIASDLKYLSADEREGRGVGTDGINQAADFIEQRWIELGLNTKLFEETPFQGFELPGLETLGSADENFLTVHFPDDTLQSLELKKDMIPLTLGRNGSFEGDLAFVGYGITARDDSGEIYYDDYEGIPVAGKIVIVMRKEPQQQDPNSFFDGREPSVHAYFTTKEENAAAHGAAAVLIVNDQASVGSSAWSADGREKIAAILDQTNALRDELAREQWSERTQTRWLRDYNALLDDLNTAVEAANQTSETLPGIEGGGQSLGKSIPTFFVRRAIIDQLLQQAELPSLSDVEQDIDRDLKPRSAVLKGITVSGMATIDQEPIQVKNVIAELAGRGTYANETVIIGAHYDHVGMGGPASLAPGTYAVHNGADDNGSGTVALLEVARELAERLRGEDHRRIVFIAFTAEELGLLGSEHYVRNPRFPLDSTVAMLNMDMVGRLKNQLTIYGTETSEGFDDLVEKHNAARNFDLEKIPSGNGPSDHASFNAVKIPVFHFFTGLHSDYHRPTDDFDTVNIAGIARISSYVTDIAYEIATIPTAPAYIEQAAVRRSRASQGRFGVQMRGQGDSVIIETVMQGSAAEEAGIQPGDQFVSVDENAIRGMSDLRKALRGTRPGSKIIVEIRRDGEVKKFEVTLGE